jgi:hypothetical protein
MEHQRAVQNLAVESYLLGDMSPSERDAFEEHFFECSLCGEDVRAAAKFMEDARKILGARNLGAEIAGEDAGADDRLTTGRPLPGSSRTAKTPGGGRTPGWLVWLKPQFAVPALAALLLLVGFQSVRTIPDLRHQLEEAVAPRVVTSIVLRRSVRGDASVLAVPAGAAVMLTLDLPEPPAKGTPLRFIIVSAGESNAGNGEKEIKRIDGVAPEPGRTLNLMIPHLDLPSGPYIVVAELTANPGAHGQELGRFPFRMELQQGADRSK